jgi:hypothetical protein
MNRNPFRNLRSPLNQAIEVRDSAVIRGGDPYAAIEAGLLGANDPQNDRGDSDLHPA